MDKLENTSNPTTLIELDNIGSGVNIKLEGNKDSITIYKRRKRLKFSFQPFWRMFFLIFFNIEYFYLGETRQNWLLKGIVKFLTGGGLGIWTMRNCIYLFAGKFVDKDGTNFRLDLSKPGSIFFQYWDA